MKTAKVLHMPLSIMSSNHFFLFMLMLFVEVLHVTVGFSSGKLHRLQYLNPYRGRVPRLFYESIQTALGTEALCSSQPINPIVMKVLLTNKDNTLDEGGDNIAMNSSNDSITIIQASSGVRIWQQALLRGRLPLREDFDDSSVWPPEPLFWAICKRMADLQLPRFVIRHKDVVDSVLLTMVRMAFVFEANKNSTTVATLEGPSDQNCEEMNSPLPNSTLDFAPSIDNLESLALEITSGLLNEYGSVLQGISSLDQLFGHNHGLLDVHGVHGFGLQDGVWQHSGWKIMPTLQRQVQSMVELRDMIQALGRRPTSDRNKDSLRRFSPRDMNAHGSMGAQFDPLSRESVDGLTLSGSFTEMLPSEAGLLLAKSQVLRRLVLAKKVESKLLSYQLSGWTDVTSLPRPNPRYYPRLPSGPGGPIVVCLDTSWSMSGTREFLSKAVVLACASAARKQRRSCQVVAFSNQRGVMDSGEISADPDGVARLLEFLKNSFGGGTDVTGALKYAMTALGSDVMAAADILLVTDGEIQDPPVSEDMMQDLDRLKRRTGMQIHGLLVGKRESKPVAKLCTQTYDFLIGYDQILCSTVSSKRMESTSLFAAGENKIRRRPRRATHYGWGTLRPSKSASLRASVELTAKPMRDSSKSFGKTILESQDEDYVDEQIFQPRITNFDDDSGNSLTLANDFRLRVNEALTMVRRSVSETIRGNLWCSSLLDTEKSMEGSCWRHRDDLRQAVATVGENLVERNEEARLLVLSMIAGEHILFLGPPGTGKSLLGSRLSSVCGGQFFQRLLTRFTTPEEIFGPLSLRALENDEYKRCTAGYLPTSSIAFLDEIFKANSAILNTLLTVLNERKFDNGSGVREDCPIKCVVGASNELPESDELDALYDRFLIRKEVLSVSDEGIMKILSMPAPGASSSASNDSSSSNLTPFSSRLDKITSELSNAADVVRIGEDICGLMRDLRRFMREELNVDVSDRRLVKAVRLLKISAASHGRICVDPIDCLLLQHVLWRIPEERAAIREWLWNNITPSATSGSTSVPAQFRVLLDSLRSEAIEAVRKTGGDVTGASGGREADITVIKSICDEVGLIANGLKQRLDALSRHIELLTRVLDHLWIEADEALAMKQLLVPKAMLVSQELMKALEDARALELVLVGPTIPDDLRISLIEDLWEEQLSDMTFTDDELDIGMREAKSKYDAETFRKWKRARKKANR